MPSFKNLSKMIRSKEYSLFIESKLGSNLFINDSDRAERIQSAAEYGADGSYHSEIIEDWREYLSSLNDDEIIEKISIEIDNCEQWHEENGSLFHEVG